MLSAKRNDGHEYLSKTCSRLTKKEIIMSLCVGLARKNTLKTMCQSQLYLTNENSHYKTVTYQVCPSKTIFAETCHASELNDRIAERHELRTFTMTRHDRPHNKIHFYVCNGQHGGQCIH